MMGRKMRSGSGMSPDMETTHVISANIARKTRTAIAQAMAESRIFFDNRVS